MRVIVIPAAFIAAFGALSWVNAPIARIAQVGLGFILLAYLATRCKGTLQNGCVVLASLFFGLTIVEGVAQYLVPRVVESGWGEWTRDADLGCCRPKKQAVMAAKKTVDGHTVFDTTYSTDGGRRRLTISNPDGVKVRFFGDSFTFGVGLADADALPQQFADLTRSNVLNFGLPGHSPAQALRILQLGTSDNDLEGARLFILQTGPYHVDRVACVPSWSVGFPKYVWKDGTLRIDGKCVPAPDSRWETYNLIARLLRRASKGQVDTYVHVVDDFIDLARQKYRADVVILDMSYNSPEIDRAGISLAGVEAHWRSKGAMVIDDALALTDSERKIPGDGHPTPLMNRLMAGKTVDYLEKNKPSLLAPLTAAHVD